MDNHQPYQEYKLNRMTWRRLAMATAPNDERWSPVAAHVEYMIQQCHHQLEFCLASDMPSLQGEIKALRQVLELRAKALKEIEYSKNQK